jgi:hypothetical protein
MDLTSWFVACGTAGKSARVATRKIELSCCDRWDLQLLGHLNLPGFAYDRDSKNA